MQTTTTKQYSAIIAMGLAFVGVFLFATKAIIVKLAYKEGMNAQTMLMLRMAFALPVYLVILFWKNNRNVIFGLSLKEHLQIIALGVLGYYLSSLLDFVGLQYISANLERLILFAYPTMVVIISAIFLKKKIDRSQIIAIVITYVGIFITLFEKIQFKSTSVEYYGIGMIFLSALTYAIYLIGSGELLGKVGTLPFTSYAMVVSTVCVMVNAAFAETTPLAEIPRIVYVYGFVMAMFATVVPSFLISAAIKMVGAAKVSIIGSVGPAFTIVLSYYILHESMSPYQMVGGVIILVGVFWVSRKK
jgi:drug/metabolite transporter (DMT)-like permease